MPTFEFEDHIEPVDIKIGDDEYRALPGIPADDFPEFLEIFGLVPPLVTRLRQPDTPETQGAQVAAYKEFIEVSMRGLELILVPESLNRLKERASDKERPIQATTLANVFSTLAGYYITGGKEAKEKVGEVPTDAASESSPSSDTTGGSSEGNSSSAAPDSPAGPTTT